MQAGAPFDDFVGGRKKGREERALERGHPQCAREISMRRQKAVHESSIPS